MKKGLLFIFAIVCCQLMSYAALQSVKVEFKEPEYENQEIVEEVKADDVITLTFAQGSNATLAPKFLSSTPALRLYYGNTMTIKAAEGYKIERFVIESYAGSYGVREGSIVSEGVFTVDDATGTWVGSASQVTFTQPGTSGNTQIKSIDVSYAEEESETRTPVKLSFPQDSYAINLDGVFNTPKVVCDVPEALAIVKYSSSNEDVATVDVSGNVSLVGAGETVVKAFIPFDNADYKETSAQYYLKVIDLSSYEVVLTYPLYGLSDTDYNIGNYSDCLGVEYTVCTKESVEKGFQFNTNIEAGYGSGLYVTNTSEKVIIKDIKIEFDPKNTGAVNIYKSNQAFGYPEKKVKYEWPTEAFMTDFSGDEVIQINDYAFGFDADVLTYIRSITVTYEAARSDESQPFECEAFEKEYVLLKGESLDLNVGVDAPAITYASSDNSVVSIEDNTLKAVRSGTAVLTASWPAMEGVWLSGSATFNVSVAFNDLGSMLSDAKEGEVCHANFNVLVACDKGSYKYVTDGKSWVLFYDVNSNHTHTEGQIIPAGWSGKYSASNGSASFTKVEHGECENATVFIPAEYDGVAITEALVNEVLILNNVTFDAATPSSAAAFNGTYNETQCRFYNQFGASQVAAGTYNVKAVVARDTENGICLYPIEYVANDAVTAVAVHKQKKYSEGDVIEFNALEAGAHIYYRYGGEDPDFSNVFSDELNPAQAPRKSSSAVGDLTYNHTTHPLTLKQGVLVKYYAKAPGKAPSEINYIALNDDGTITGISTIFSDDDSSPVYFNLQGVRVDGSELTAGVYIRVANGRASKVVIR